MTKKKPVPLVVLEASLAAYEERSRASKSTFASAAAEFRAQWSEYLAGLARKQHKGLFDKMNAERDAHVNFGDHNYRQVHLSTNIDFGSHEKGPDRMPIVSVSVAVKVPPRELIKWRSRAAKISKLRSTLGPKRRFVHGVIDRNPQIADKIVKLLNEAIQSEQASKLTKKKVKKKS